MVPAAAVVTAIYDRYDTLKDPHRQTVPVEWVCVTDDEALHRGDADPRGWTIVYEPRPGERPVVAAKWPKALPADYTAAPASVWLDGSMQVASPTFVADLLALADPIAQYAHPQRSCLYDEANVCAGLPKAAGEPIGSQMEHYRGAGMPARWGLWATGVIARRHTRETYAWGLRWLAEIHRWSVRDQLAHPYVCWRLGLRPATVPGDCMATDALRYRLSGRH